MNSKAYDIIDTANAQVPYKIQPINYAKAGLKYQSSFAKTNMSANH